MEQINNNIKLKFIPNTVPSFDNFIKEKTIFINDIYEKYSGYTTVKGDLLVCNDASKMKSSTHKIKRESYNDYLNFIKNYNIEKDKWIYNIIDGLNEQNSIIYKDELCIIIPPYTFDGKDIGKLHILSIPTDKTLRCLRDLRQKHIPLLEHMMNKTISIISSKYNLNLPDLKIYFHYEPSVYHLHIHFVNVEFIDANSSVEYSHEINNVIYNLLLDDNYYKNIILNVRN